MVAVLEVLYQGSAQIPQALMWQITMDLEKGVMVAVLEVLYLGSAQIPQALIVLYMADHNGPGDGCDGGCAEGSLPGLSSNTTDSHCIIYVADHNGPGGGCDGGCVLYQCCGTVTIYYDSGSGSDF